MVQTGNSPATLVMLKGLATETEVKIRIDDAAAMRRRLRTLGYVIHAPRVFESNTLFDTPEAALCDKGELIRVRRVGKEGVLTFKGPGVSHPYKSREEIETRITDPNAMQSILERLGLHRSFRYDKYRTEYEYPRQRGIITVDETPVGNFIELEGLANWIDRTATKLGFSPADYITCSYGRLYVDYCREHGLQPGDMTFPNITKEERDRQAGPNRPR